MAITDLLRSVPNPLAARRAAADAADGPAPPSGDGLADALPAFGPVSAELAAGSGAGDPFAPEPAAAEPAAGDAPPGWAPVAFADDVAVPWAFPEPVAAPPSAEASAAPDLPGGPPLARTAAFCLAVSVAAALAALALLSSTGADDAPPAEAPPAEVLPATAAPGSASPGASTGTAEPTPLSAETLARLEASANDALPVELGHLLAAMSEAFGTESARLDPALRPYVYRLAGRFEWNPDTFRVAVSAPTDALAAARADLLTTLFPEAVAAGRLAVTPTVGPHALFLVTE